MTVCGGAGPARITRLSIQLRSVCAFASCPAFDPPPNQLPSAESHARARPPAHPPPRFFRSTLALPSSCRWTFNFFLVLLASCIVGSLYETVELILRNGFCVLIEVRQSMRASADEIALSSPKAALPCLARPCCC
eukprot:2273202-Pleurochrysis_carterae.AAC.3